jgi:two-component system chemotaxis response regulator CheY
VCDQPESDVKTNGRCLIVDDSPTVRRIAGRILRSFNMEVDEAGDGQEALDKCLQGMPETILLDWNMPVMDGLEFLRALRQTEGGGAARVIMCTTETDVTHVQQAFDAGANEYIMKPFDAAMLREKVFGVAVGLGAGR